MRLVVWSPSSEVEYLCLLSVSITVFNFINRVIMRLQIRANKLHVVLVNLSSKKFKIIRFFFKFYFSEILISINMVMYLLIFKQSLNVNHLLLQFLSNCLTNFEDSLLPPAEINSCLQVLFLVKLHKPRVSTIEFRSRCSSLLDIVMILGDVSLKS